MISAVSLHSHWWIVVLLSFVLFVLPAGYFFDQLVRYQYMHHRARWEADGRPRGVFWSAPEAVRSEEDFLCYSWFWQTPDWIANDRDCLRKLYIFRALVMAEILVCISLAATLII
jgi:hypothetical protein